MVNAAKLLAGEVATNGVTINTVTVGRIESHQIDRSRYADEDTLATEMAATIPIGRYGRPAEVAAAVLFSPPRSRRPTAPAAPSLTAAAEPTLL